MDDLIGIEGVEPSARIRDRLAGENRPVLLAFSCGKDALAAWLALEDSGVQVMPAYLYYVPGLRFVEDSLDAFEQHFGRRIARYPHPSLWRWLNNLVFQSPERCAVIEAARMPTLTYEQTWELIREDLGLDADTWVADGVRAADSPARRVSIVNHGAMKPTTRKVSVVWDWRKRHTFEAIEAAGVDLPPDYEWFGRSFDGLDYRFLEPLSRRAPADYERVLDWFPLADLELVRHGL